MCCMFKISFCFLGDGVVLETFKMGHGTNFAFSVIGPWSKKEYGIGECCLGLISDPQISLDKFLNLSET